MFEILDFLVWLTALVLGIWFGALVVLALFRGVALTGPKILNGVRKHMSGASMRET